MSVIGQSNITLHTQKRTFAASLNEQWLIEEQIRIHGKVLVRSLKFEVWGITVIASILINEVVWYIFAKRGRAHAHHHPLWICIRGVLVGVEFSTSYSFIATCSASRQNNFSIINSSCGSFLFCRPEQPFEQNVYKLRYTINTQLILIDMTFKIKVNVININFNSWFAFLLLVMSVLNK